MANRRLPHLAYNWISGAGAVLAGTSFCGAALLLVLSAFSQVRSPYVGVVLYFLLPALVILGLLLIPLGMWGKSRRLDRAGGPEPPPWPRIDLNDRRERNGLLVFAFGSVVFVLTGIVGVYQAYRYTDSPAFCGLLCHAVMSPEYATHRISPHAHVSCTGCHVGPGVGWYAKSKMRGVDRVWEVLRGTYPRPIPVPISDLKPTQIECHHCHWPAVFYGGRDWHFDNHLYDAGSTHWPIDMVIHIGGGDPAIERTSGIHWYMYVGYRIEYIARDAKRQDIPWVRATNRKTGEVTVYQDQSRPLSRKEIATATPVTLDCVDCHNAPTHRFHTPDEAIDRSLATRQIDPDLPDIKRVAVEAMARGYDTREDALQGIAKQIDAYYQKNHPKLYRQDRGRIEGAIKGVQARFRDNVFVAMKADWRTYPDNLGHFYSPGCFRCHLGNHKSASGKTISHDCTTCHSIVAQGSGERAETSGAPGGLAFEHPVDIGGIWKQVACSDCHTGTRP